MSSIEWTPRSDAFWTLLCGTRFVFAESCGVSEDVSSILDKSRLVDDIEMAGFRVSLSTPSMRKLSARPQGSHPHCSSQTRSTTQQEHLAVVLSPSTTKLTLKQQSHPLTGAQIVAGTKQYRQIHRAASDAPERFHEQTPSYKSTSYMYHTSVCFPATISPWNEGQSHASLHLAQQVKSTP